MILDKIAPERMAIYTEIERERLKQDEQWGGSKHDDRHGVRDWVTYIVVYLGKAAGHESERGDDLGFSRIMLVKVAALCVAALESFDRKIAKLIR